jgi:Na+-driven multidrug efflux pump
VLNAVFIFGLFGLPQMGVAGAALATLAARVVELVWAILLSYRKGYLHPQLGQLMHRKQLLSRDFRKCVLPILGASIFWGVGFTSYSAFMGHLGTDAAAANSVAAVVRDLICCLCNGIASGGGILVGNELGAGHLDTGKSYGERLARIAFAVGFLSTAVMLLLTPVLLRFVKLTDGARTYLLGMMIIMAIYMIGRAVNTIVINGIFNAGGDTLFDMYSLAVCMWGIAVPLAAAGTFYFHWPALVVYACTCLDEVGKIPWVMYHFKKYKWVKDLTR